MRYKAIIAMFMAVLCAGAGARAHDGMLALYADVEQLDCSKELGVEESTNIYLFYVKGGGPTMGNAYEFRLVRSSTGAVFTGISYPLSAQPNTILGDIESGAAIIRNGGTALEDLCDDSVNEIHLATIGIVNLSDADSFSVTVEGNPSHLYTTDTPRITGCEEPFALVHEVAGGTFVFNSFCYDPLNPYSQVGTEASSWGAIKNMYRD
jgi:hypothetical protein